jgi:uncharacterized RDD family membrane protein YckC
METNVLDEFRVEKIRADKSLRFVNLLIDTIAFYLFAIFIGVIIGISNPEALDEGNLSITSYVISISIFLLYFSGFEALTNGRTLGKLITGTRVVKEDGTPLQFRDTFKRALSRIVPFEAFSGFAERPWHDSWTGTTVVKILK